MADEEQLALLLRSVEEWNQWRKENPGVKIDLSNAYLSKSFLRDSVLHENNLYEISFSDINLKDANLSYAVLFGAYLLESNLKGVYLRGADLRIAELIGADISNADLSETDLRRASLMRANLAGVNLKRANLSTTQALSTNFRGATLTGSCIQDWNINNETNLDGVICEYIYLNYTSQNNKLTYTDRRPHNPDRRFEPGEFTQIFQKLHETLDLYFKDGVDWQAAAYSFQTITTDGTPLDIEGVNIQGWWSCNHSQRTR